MKFPEDLKYTKKHGWIKLEGKQIKAGITEYAQNQLGDIVFIEMPEIGKKVKQMEPFGIIESVKSISDLFSPISGNIIDINKNLVDEPEIINQDPYVNGWIVVIEMDNSQELEKLLSAADYTKYVAEERE